MLTPTPNSSLTADSHPRETGSLLVFFIFIAALVVTPALAIVAAHCPPRVRLLGLFLPGLGALWGWLLAQLAKRLRCPSRSIVIVTIGIVTLCGLMGATWQAFRLDVQNAAKHEFNPMAAALEAQLRQSPETIPDELKASLSQALDSSPARRFRGYLARRIQALGLWPSPWPELFWGAELIAGTTASILAALRVGKQESSS